MCVCVCVCLSLSLSLSRVGPAPRLSRARVHVSLSLSLSLDVEGVSLTERIAGTTASRTLCGSGKTCARRTTIASSSCARSPRGAIVSNCNTGQRCQGSASHSLTLESRAFRLEDEGKLGVDWGVDSSTFRVRRRSRWVVLPLCFLLLGLGRRGGDPETRRRAVPRSIHRARLSSPLSKK